MSIPGASRAKALIAAAALVGLAACTGGSSPAGPLQGGTPGIAKVVSSLPRTGSANAQTTSIVNGMKMALDEAGWKAGELKLVYEDWDDASATRGTWDPAVEAQNADKAIKDPDVMAYIGTYNSGAAKISMPKMNEAGLVMISPANTWPGFTKPGTGEANEPEVYRPRDRITYFRVVPADDIQAVAAANWAKKLGVKSVYVLHDRELYGKGVADLFKRHCDKIGVEAKGYEGIDTRAANYKSLAAKIKGDSPDLVYFGGTTQSNGGQLAKDLRGSGYPGKVMVPDGCYEQAFIDSAGAENLGETYVTFGGLPPDRQTGKGAEFYAKYKERFGREPEGYAIYGYEATKVAVDAIARAGKKDREAIRRAVAETKDFDGALGRWSFDANGDTTLRTMSGMLVKDGKFEFVEVLGQ